VADKGTLRYKIIAAPIGPGGDYRAGPDKTTYIRRFATESRREDYWRRFVVPKTGNDRGLLFQVAMIDEWNDGWKFVGEARYSDEPLICKWNCDQSLHVVECGREGLSRKAS
jgi:hypothetical protein